MVGQFMDQKLPAMTPLRPRNMIYRKAVPGIEPVPNQFKPVQNYRYPSDNAHAFERWYLDTFQSSDKTARVYLPVQWTAHYCNNRFGQDKGAIAQLQRYLDGLDTSKPFYTIVQFDDGILNNIDHLDLKIFSMGGGRVDYPIPLLCQPHKFHATVPRETLASFIGNETHAIRKQVFALEGKPGYYISRKPHKMTEYTEWMHNSAFSLAPRGYGSSSFRIAEAVHALSIPVYLSDHHCLPYNMPFDYGVLLRPGDDIDAALQAADVTSMQQRLREVKELFTYQGCKNMILKELRNE
jgi:hypothetical protein